LIDSASLSQEQKQAFGAFQDWLGEDLARDPFVLSGFAGTGKTFLSMRFLAEAEALGLCWTVAAPTHKAVDVLREHLQCAGLRPTWYPSTLHRLLRLKLRRQHDRELCQETAQTGRSLESLRLVLIDEASMLDSSLLEITLRCAHPFATRLIFVGDPAQLPPVTEEVSPVFSGLNARSVALTQVVRHSGAVLRLAHGLRSGALPCEAPPALPVLESLGGRVAFWERADWLGAAQAALRRCAEAQDPNLARILCYTNRSLERLVPIARRAVYGAAADGNPVLPGEVLITRAAVMGPACREPSEAAGDGELVLGSNRELKVLEVEPELCDLSAFGGGAPTALIETFNLRVHTGEGECRLRLMPPIGSKARGELEAALRSLRSQALAADQGQARWLWRHYFQVRDAFAPLGPASVLTVHRSQGSTFGEVFVDGDVFTPADRLLRRRLIYVAVSRASKAVALMAQPGPPGREALWLRWLNGES
jgi:exodeoxyribonuclease-5